ncbi:MAG: class I SAM-dependent methyltransferase [Acidobacteriia bacterium]|nr:class I SAM-dependent methyltransferase [Terriglobia bacterium]
MNETASAFDAGASSFERFRALPDGVPEAIRSTIYDTVHVPSPARVLDLGAGTGRIGRIFAQAGDLYCGLDASLGMLQEFRRNAKNSFLVQANGEQLPFRDHAFDVVLLMHVLGGTRDFQAVIQEARRVCNSDGAIVVGRTASPESGIDAQLKRQLKLILEQMGVVWHRPQESYRKSLASLEAISRRRIHMSAISWNVTATARDFLLRHQTGARFATLPTATQERALERLTTYTVSNFGALDKTFEEQRSFELDIFVF